jgi:Invasin, domain 3
VDDPSEQAALTMRRTQIPSFTNERTTGEATHGRGHAHGPQWPDNGPPTAAVPTHTALSNMEDVVRASLNHRHRPHRPAARGRGGIRRLGLTALTVLTAGLAGATAMPVAASAATAPRIDMKVLLLGTSATEPDFTAWEAALNREGVRFDTIVGASHTPISTSSLETTLTGGALEAKYDAVIVSVGDLIDCSTGTCVSDLTPAEWTTLEQYEHQFNIRQISGDVYPSTTYGMNTPASVFSTDGTAATAVSGSLTTDGQKVFPYLNSTASISMDTGTYGYEATPVSASNFDSLVTGPGGSSLVGIYTHPDGVEEMVETFNQNANQTQSFLLRHGAIDWVTRGVYFGDQRNYLEADVDDNFLSDDTWSIAGNATTAPHSTDYDPADALREVPADVLTAANWSKANNFRIDMLFNGGGSAAVSGGGSLVGAGDGGSGTTGSTGTSGSGGTGSDPLLTQFTTADPATGKPYTDDFGWISHTWDHPNLDEGCATQNYIEAELNQNTAWGTASASSGGLGLTETTDPTAALGSDNPQVVITGEHSGLANLLPGNPGQVDPPSLDDASVGTTAGTFGSSGPAVGQYVYAVTDQFNTATPGATPVAGTGQSAASVSTPVSVVAGKSVSLSWGAVCHAADYQIYRAPWTPDSPGASTGTIGAWSKIGTVQANTATDFANPASTSNVTGGGAVSKTFTDTGLAGTITGSSGNLTATSTPASEGSAVESPYEQNPLLDAAFAATAGGGIKVFGADASKPYPTPADAAFATGAYTGAEANNGASFQDAGATGVPRYPTNIYYNVSTNAQEVDEYETLYDSAPSGNCQPIAGVTTCNPSGTAFTIGQIVASVDQGMFQHMMGNDPRPDYFHQTNLMAQTTGSTTGEGDGLFYETLNPLLAEYNQQFASSAPIEQPTMAQIAQLLNEQSTWAANTTVTGYIQGNQVTITNSGASAVTLPLSGIPSVGSSYGGNQSGWTSVPAGSSTYTASTTWPVDSLTVALSPTAVTANGTATTQATATVTADGNPVAGDPITFTSTDSGEKVGTVTDNNNGTYTATITSSTAVGSPTITATDAAVTPNAVGTAVLTQTAGVAASEKVSLSPATITADGKSTTVVTATLSDAQGHPLSGQQIGFTSSDSGEKIGTVTDHNNGTYTATITSSTKVGQATITATDRSSTPVTTAQATLTQTAVASTPASPPTGTTPPKASAPVSVTAPAISGRAQVGTTLTVQPGTWSGTQPLTFTYQWQRCSATCTAIAGATRSSLALSQSAVGEHLRVLVTATNAAGSVQRASAEVGPVAAPVKPRTLLMSLIVPAGRAISGSSLLQHSGYTRVVATPGTGRLSITWYAGGGHTPRLVVARAVTRLRGGQSKIAIRLTAVGRRVLSGSRQVTLLASGKLVLTGQATADASRTFVVHR